MKKNYNDHFKEFVKIDKDKRAGLPIIYKYLYYFRFKTQKRENVLTPYIDVPEYNTKIAVAEGAQKLLSTIIDLNLIVNSHGE